MICEDGSGPLGLLPVFFRGCGKGGRVPTSPSALLRGLGMTGGLVRILVELGCD